MLYRDNEILIFDEPTAVLTPQEIDELMEIMQRVHERGQVHPLHHPQAQRDHGGGRPLHRPAQGQVYGHGGHQGHHQGRAFPHDGGPRRAASVIEKSLLNPGESVLDVENRDRPRQAKQERRRQERVVPACTRGEIVCIAGIDGNGQTEFIYGLTGLERLSERHALRSTERTSPVNPSASAPRTA